MIEITEETYPSLLPSLVGIGRMVIQATAPVDLGEMRAVCERLQTLAPIADPTSYGRGGDLNLRDQATFLAALDRFVTDLRNLDRAESGG